MIHVLTGGQICPLVFLRKTLQKGLTNRNVLV